MPQGEKAKLLSRQRLYPWTTTHSHLACMGGFAFENSNDESQCPFPDGRRRVTLSPDGLVLLAKLSPDVIPDISHQAIHDKSKASSFMKIVTLTQALWFCLQVIVRLAQQLPVTLLELNTFAHSFCALFIFILWWNKPVDVSDPFTIPVASPRGHPTSPIVQRTAMICAAMCNASEIGRNFRCLKETHGNNYQPYRHKGLMRTYVQIWGHDQYLHDFIAKHRRASLAGPAEPEVIQSHPPKHDKSYSLSQSPVKQFPIASPVDSIIEQFSRRHRLFRDDKITVYNLMDHDPILHFRSSVFRGHTHMHHGSELGSVAKAVAQIVGFLMRIPAHDIYFQVPRDYWARARLVALGPGALSHDAAEIGADASGSKRETIWLADPSLALTNNEQYVFSVRSHSAHWVCNRVANWSSSLSFRHVFPRTDDKAPSAGGLAENGVVFEEGTDTEWTVFSKRESQNIKIITKYMVMFVATSVGYGAWHLLAWAGPFHSHTQMILWRGSGIGVGAAGVAVISLFFVSLSFIYCINAGRGPKDEIRGPKKFTVLLVVGLIALSFVGTILFHIACRLCLVVESLVGLAYVPDGAFVLPHWAIYFPHIG